MVTNVYSVRDVVADDCFLTFHSKNDGMAIRDNLPALSRVRPLQDLRFYCVGSYDTEKMILEPLEPRFVPLDSYKFPENEAVASAGEIK